jgi:acyl transferase domain-containing protein
LERAVVRAGHVVNSPSASFSDLPVAIVGIGCRFPGGVAGPASLWTLLDAGVDAVSPIPENRFALGNAYDSRAATVGNNMPRWGGFLDGIEDFDAEFFGISPREAERLDHPGKRWKMPARMHIGSEERGSAFS